MRNIGTNRRTMSEVSLQGMFSIFHLACSISLVTIVSTLKRYAYKNLSLSLSLITSFFCSSCSLSPTSAQLFPLCFARARSNSLSLSFSKSFRLDQPPNSSLTLTPFLFIYAILDSNIQL